MILPNSIRYTTGFDKIRVYGRSDASSFGTVTAGWLKGLRDLGLNVELSTRETGMEAAYEENCPICVVTDPGLYHISRAFSHARRFLVIAPHSGFLPANLAGAVEVTKTHLLPPSQFCADLLKDAIPEAPCTVVEHGVDEAFLPQDQEAVRSKLGALRGPGLNFVHFAEGSLDRKSTFTVLDAFIRAIEDDGIDATLTCVVSGAAGPQVAMWGMKDERLRERIRVLPRVAAKPEKMRSFYQAFDFLIQPSRVEGFGLCPLEALCCGVPSIVSEGTGHLQWLQWFRAGAVLVDLASTRMTMELEQEQFSGLSNLCPVVTTESVQEAILRAVHNASSLRRSALAVADDRREAHSWKNALRRFTRILEET